LYLKEGILIILDAQDINTLVDRFDSEQLRNEITTARKRLKGEIDYHWQAYYEDYIKACQLAIHILWKPRPHKDPKFRESIEDIKNRIDLAEYIGRFVKLNKCGSKFQGLCPFHADKRTESFTVYPNGWHCFGCNKSGDLISFVMNYENVDTKQAIERLSN
jgi:hypothetical protein